MARAPAHKLTFPKQLRSPLLRQLGTLLGSEQPFLDPADLAKCSVDVAQTICEDYGQQQLATALLDAVEGGAARKLSTLVAPILDPKGFPNDRAADRWLLKQFEDCFSVKWSAAA